MSKTIDLEPNPQEGLKDALDRLMDAGGFAGVVSLGSTSGGAVDYLLVMKGQDISDLRPLHPVIPNQVGRLLRELTLRGPLKERLLVIARPCELRGFVEMVKRQQGDLTNMVFMSMVCSGAYSLSMAASGKVEGRSKEYWSSLGKGSLPDLRPACRVCTEFVPYTADLMVAPMEEGGWSLTARSEEGSRIIEAAFPETREGNVDQAVSPPWPKDGRPIAQTSWERRRMCTGSQTWSRYSDAASAATPAARPAPSVTARCAPLNLLAWRPRWSRWRRSWMSREG